MAVTDLQCPNSCDGDRFEALNAPLYVNRNGRYLSHDSSMASYRCAVCSSIALDLAAVSRQLLRDEAAAVAVLTCPNCGVMMLPPDDDPFADLVECPQCETRFSIDEGTRGLHRGKYEITVDDEDLPDAF